MEMSKQEEFKAFKDLKKTIKRIQKMIRRTIVAAQKNPDNFLYQLRVDGYIRFYGRLLDQLEEYENEGYK